MTRLNLICLILGIRGSGKTTYLLKLLAAYITRGTKILIIDTIDHPSYRHIPVMDLKKLKDFKSGVYRVWVRAEDMPKLNYLINSLPNMWNTLLVYEDAYKHTGKNVDKSLKQLIGDSKQKNIDIIFMYWSWMQAPGDLYRMLDVIECFKTKDSPEARKSYMGGYFEEAIQIWQSIMNHESQYHHKLIDAGR
jgi:hypothetical protein